MRETFLGRRCKIITFKIILEHFRIMGPRSVLGTLPLVRVFTDETPTRVFKFRFSGDRAIARKITRRAGSHQYSRTRSFLEVDQVFGRSTYREEVAQGRP